MSFFADKNQQKGGLTRIFNTLIFSRDGLVAAWKEAAFRQLVFLHIPLIFLALIFVSKDNGKLLLITVSFLSLVVELVNTGIEAVVDRISLERHPLSKIAKDCGSAAQLLMLILCAVLWVLVCL
ncbi:MAG: diacylglycerol kinase [Cardiobacteriaceae bacterium]|nr:diacylglycerol kinase [Cardiobacteriaceae bacterium]